MSTSQMIRLLRELQRQTEENVDTIIQRAIEDIQLEERITDIWRQALKDTH
eukprot:m.151536 g.151536  ORF g.151536 m.151536 type:complete len:51 (-) comp16200_c8_seq2:83-235(-)